MMFGAQKTRTLLGPTDPARSVAPPVGPPATELIERATIPAEPTAGVTPRRGANRPVRRRLVIAAAAGATVAIAIGYAVSRPAPAPPEAAHLGAVALPIAYELTTDPPPAADHLRDLAASIIEAPYEDSTATYSHHYAKSWGDIIQGSPEGHEVGYVQEREMWVGPDAVARQRTATLGVEFPDPESRDYWESLDGFEEDIPRERVEDVPVPEPLPEGRAALAERLRIADGAAAVFKPVMTLFSQYPLPRDVRAEALELLAEVPGWVWRGEVTDRDGRAGVAISYDSEAHGQRGVLVFDPRTGELLAQEQVELTPAPSLGFYAVFATDRTDQRPEPTGPVTPSPTP